MKILNKVFGLLPHVSIVLALCFLAFTVLDWYNPLMAFTTNPLSSKLLVVFCVVSIASSLVSVAAARRQKDARRRERENDRQMYADRA